MASYVLEWANGDPSGNKPKKTIHVCVSCDEAYGICCRCFGAEISEALLRWSDEDSRMCPHCIKILSNELLRELETDIEKYLDSIEYSSHERNRRKLVEDIRNEMWSLMDVQDYQDHYNVKCIPDIFRQLVTHMTQGRDDVIVDKTKQRTDFVQKCGELLNIAKPHLLKCEFVLGKHIARKNHHTGFAPDDEYVVVTCENASTYEINITGNSLGAIAEAIFTKMVYK